jgi:hypothetical protein
MAFDFDLGLVAMIAMGRAGPRGGQRFGGNGIAMDFDRLGQLDSGAGKVQFDPVFQL